MSKTLGQIAYEASPGSAGAWQYIPTDNKRYWEAAAAAVVEECAKALEGLDCNANDPSEHLRSLSQAGDEAA